MRRRPSWPERVALVVEVACAVSKRDVACVLLILHFHLQRNPFLMAESPTTRTVEAGLEQLGRNDLMGHRRILLSGILSRNGHSASDLTKEA